MEVIAPRRPAAVDQADPPCKTIEHLIPAQIYGVIAAEFAVNPFICHAIGLT